MKKMISAVVLTKDAQKTIERCLGSLAWADEVIVIDDHSSDKTVSLAKKLGASVLTRGLAGDFATQRNFSLKKAKNEWVLFVDSDEEVSPALRKEIEAALEKANQAVGGFYFKRQDVFLGKILRYGETGAVRLLRLARKGAGSWTGNVHETWQIKGKTATLNRPLLHQRSVNLGQFMKRLSWYAQLRAKELYGRKTRESYSRLFLNPVGKFLQNYGWRFGFLDGFPGLAMAWFMSWHSLLVRLWLQLLWRNNGKPVFKPDSRIWQ